MSILALDLSSTRTGWSTFSKDGRLLNKGNIVPDDKIDHYFKIHYVANEVKALFKTADELIIEDIFLGGFGGKFNVTVLKYLARLSGAILYAWIVQKYKIPHFYMAVSARAKAGCNAHSHKSEIQLFICQEYKFAKKELLDKYEKEILEIKAVYCTKELSSKKRACKKYSKEAKKFQKEIDKLNRLRKKELGKISDLIEKETGIGEDIADSIVLNRAYYNDNKEK